MTVQYKPTEPLLKRVATVQDFTDGIQRWGLDNLYPQTCEELVGRAFTLKAVMDKVTDFLNGEGIEDEDIGSIIVNEEGQTLNDIVNLVAEPYAKYKIISLHIGYDLNYEISSIRYIPVKYLRFGLPDSEGCVTKIKYCTNWERDFRMSNQRVIETYDIYNPDPEVVAEQIDEAGGIEEYKGQMVFLTPELWQYPKATFDPIFDQAQTQAEIATSRLAGLQNSFVALMAVVIPGEAESDDEEDDVSEILQNKMGSKNFGSTIGFRDKTGMRKANEIFQSLTPPNLDKLFDSTDQASKDAIMENEAMPKELLGVRPESGMFNQDNMEQAYIYFNAMTKNRRNKLASFFTVLMMHWNDPVKKAIKIKPQQYSSKPIISAEQMQYAPMATEGILKVQAAINGGQYAYESGIAILIEMYGFVEDIARKVLLPKGVLVAPSVDPITGKEPAAPAPIVDPNQPPAPVRQVNPHLQNLNAQQHMQVKRIVRDFKKGQLNQNQAQQQLVQGFGFTAEEATAYLAQPEEAA